MGAPLIAVARVSRQHAVLAGAARARVFLQDWLSCEVIVLPPARWRRQQKMRRSMTSTAVDDDAD